MHPSFLSKCSLVGCLVSDIDSFSVPSELCIGKKLCSHIWPFDSWYLTFDRHIWPATLDPRSSTSEFSKSKTFGTLIHIPANNSWFVHLFEKMSSSLERVSDEWRFCLKKVNRSSMTSEKKGFKLESPRLDFKFSVLNALFSMSWQRKRHGIERLILVLRAVQ